MTIVPLDQFTKLFPALQNDMGQFVFRPAPDADEQRVVAQTIFESLKNLKEFKPERVWDDLAKTSISLILNLSQELVNIIWQYGDGLLLRKRDEWTLANWIILLAGIHEDEDDDHDLDAYYATLLLHSPWDNNEEHQNLIRLLIEEEQYKPLQRNEVLREILLHIYPAAPVDILNIISGYDQNTRALLVKEIEEFINKIISLYDPSQFSIWAGDVFNKYIAIMKEFLAALWYLNVSKQISPNDAYLEICTSFVTGKIFYKNAPVDSPYRLTRISKKDVTFSTTVTVNDPPITNPTILAMQSTTGTLLPIVMSAIERLDFATIKDIPRILSNVRALIASFCPLSMNIPAHFAFPLTQEIEKSLYNHVERLKQGDELKGWTLKGKKDLNNMGDEPELLIKTLSVLEEKVTRINCNGNGVFFITPKNVETSVRLSNYHKRSDTLKILCDYISENKNSFLKLAPKYSKEAKNLMNRLLNTPYGSPKGYVIINEIDQWISTSETSFP